MDSVNAASAGSPANKGSLVTRLLSALVLLPLLIFVVWWGMWPVIITVAIATVISLFELYSAFQAGGFRPRHWVGVIISVSMVAGVAFQPWFSLDLIPMVLAGATILSLLSELRQNDEDNHNALASWALTYTGALYTSWLLSHFILLRTIDTPLKPSILSPLGFDSGSSWVYYVLAVTFLQDTFAYFAGRHFGRHKLAPILSPKKTWEGAIGGMLGAVVASLVAAWLWGLPIGWGAAVFLGIVGGLVGPLGDLSESLIKRRVGVKDIGKIIPGHGGVLDRADSLLFTAPVLYYLILLIFSI